ncbi:MAG: HEPN domain-containing protein [Bacteroidales bacterium]|nr:HEPN domain-containing protein [Bacteroidales bacterium]MCF8389405.1 HEPN domain-containing protein [Bacteroidales bacterium]
MKTKQEHIDFWIQQAEDDWSAVDTLFSGKKYLHALFFAHLVIEKVCKAIWIKHNKENFPPRTHNLIFLLSTTSIELTDEKSEFLLSLNRFQLEGRYPDYSTKLNDICNEEFTKSMLETTNELKIWLLENLQ